MTRKESVQAALDGAQAQHLDGRRGQVIGFALNLPEVRVRWQDGTTSRALCADLDLIPT